MEDFKLIYDQYRGLIRRFIWHYVRNEQDVEDLVQITFLKAWLYRDSFRGDCLFTTWLCTIAKNTTLNFLTSRNHKMVLNGGDLDNMAHPADEILELITKDYTLYALDYLSEEQLELVDLLLLGYSYKQLASTLGIPIGTVRSRIHRIKKILSSQL